MDGTISWKRIPKTQITLAHIQNLMEMKLEKAVNLPTEDKRIWLNLRIDKEKRDSGRGNDIYSAEPILLLVEREYFLRDSFCQFKTIPDLDLRREIKINFLNEISQDAGGLIREWFSVLIEELFDPKFELWTMTKTREKTYMINEYSGNLHKDHLEYYYFCGQIIAKAIFEAIPIKAHLNKVLLKQILGIPIKIPDDIRYLDEEVYSSMQYILTTQLNNETDFLGNFTLIKTDPITHLETTFELKENGALIPINNENKSEFVNLYFQKSFITSVELQTQEFLSGFATLLPKNIISVLDPDEFDLFMCGITDTIDIKDWQANTLYTAPYNSTHPTVILFWDFVSKQSHEILEKLLRFCTGSRRVPAEGFKGLRAANGQIRKFTIEPKIQSEKSKYEGFIVGHTCFNKLELPIYKDSKTLEENILKVLEAPGYFQFTFE